MTKLTIDLSDYSEEDQELLKKILHKFDPIPDKWIDVETTEYPIWKPEEDEIYWHVEVYGTVRDERYYNNDGTSSKSFDVIQYEKGNVFKTKEAAQRMADRRKRIGIFENKMMEFAGNTDEEFYIAYGTLESEWMIFPKIYDCPTTIYMSKPSAHKAVEWANKYYPDGLF